MISSELLAIAHRGMVVLPQPTLRHQKTGRQLFREGVAFRRQDFADPTFNFAAVLGPSPPLARIRALADEFFADLPCGYGILVEADAGHPVEAELRAAGWHIIEDEPALVLPHLPDPPPLPSGLEVRRVTTPKEMRAQFEMVAAAFETSMETLKKMIPPPSLLEDPDAVLLAGYCEGKLVCGAMHLRVEEICTVHGVAVLHAYRRCGFGKAITWAAVQAGKEQGCTVAALRAMGISHHMYQRMGFIQVCKHRTYGAPPAVTPHAANGEPGR
jgi:GNAT superfamily N-acetyltransferase